MQVSSRHHCPRFHRRLHQTRRRDRAINAAREDLENPHGRDGTDEAVGHEEGGALHARLMLNLFVRLQTLGVNGLNRVLIAKVQPTDEGGCRPDARSQDEDEGERTETPVRYAGPEGDRDEPHGQALHDAGELVPHRLRVNFPGDTWRRRARRVVFWLERGRPR